MAINIQEILHPSDSDSIKFEKINYNFDQILAHGGGPQGPRGFKGAQGLPGETGQKGEKGDLGPQGLKGAAGATDSPWYSINVDIDGDSSTTIDSYNILKPKVLGAGYSPIVWLGDDSFTEDSTEGDITTNAKLTISKSGIFDNYIKLWHNELNNGNVVVTSTDDGIFSEFAIQNDFGSQNIALKLNVDKVYLQANSSTFDIRGNAITLESLNDTNIKFKTLGSGVLDVDINSEFKGYVLLPNGTTGQRPSNPTPGMIYFNTQLDITEVYYANAGVGEWRELCTTCGESVPNTIGFGFDIIDADIDGSPVNNTLDIEDGDIDANSDGSPVADAVTTVYLLDPYYTLETGGSGTVVDEADDGTTVSFGFSVDDFSVDDDNWGDTGNNLDSDTNREDVFIDGGDSGGSGGTNNTPSPTPSNSPYSIIGDVDDRGPDVGYVPTGPSNPWTINAAGLAGVTPTLGVTQVTSDAQPGSVVDLTIVAAISTGYDFDSSLSVVLGNGTDSRFQLVGIPTLATDGSQLTFTVRDTNTPSVGGSSTISFFILTGAEVTGDLVVTSNPPVNQSGAFVPVVWNGSTSSTRDIYYQIETSTGVTTGANGAPIVTSLPSWLEVSSNTGPVSSGGIYTGYITLNRISSPLSSDTDTITFTHPDVSGEFVSFQVEWEAGSSNPPVSQIRETI